MYVLRQACWVEGTHNEADQNCAVVEVKGKGDSFTGPGKDKRVVSRVPIA